jgi:hypothetical protein
MGFYTVADLAQLNLLGASWVARAVLAKSNAFFSLVTGEKACRAVSSNFHPHRGCSDRQPLQGTVVIQQIPADAVTLTVGLIIECSGIIALKLRADGSCGMDSGRH